MTIAPAPTAKRIPIIPIMRAIPIRLIKRCHHLIRASNPVIALCAAKGSLGENSLENDLPTVLGNFPRFYDSASLSYFYRSSLSQLKKDNQQLKWNMALGVAKCKGVKA
jgi:hypothetical protein